jgi:hypothetical protein
MTMASSLGALKFNIPMVANKALEPPQRLPKPQLIQTGKRHRAFRDLPALLVILAVFLGVDRLRAAGGQVPLDQLPIAVLNTMQTARGRR